MDTNAYWYVGGRWVHPHEAVISINDIAVLRGYSAFEALRTYDRRPFHLDEHLKRLYRSAELIELEISWPTTFIADVINETIGRNSYRHAAIRLLVTGGESEDSITPTGQPTLVVMITPLGERDMQRFGALKRQVGGISTRMLTARLRLLEEMGSGRGAHARVDDPRDRDRARE